MEEPAPLHRAAPGALVSAHSVGAAERAGDHDAGPQPRDTTIITPLLLGTTVAITLAVLALKIFRRGERGSAVEDFARIEL